MHRIDSAQNKIAKEIKSLSNKKDREKRKLFLLEGERLISEIPSAEDIAYIVVSESYKGSTDKYDNVYLFSDKLFSSVCGTVNPQGIMAVCHIKDSEPLATDNDKSPLYIVLENVTDPGNMGTIIRTADAAGADAVFLSPGCVDIYNPKVIRATMGSIFHLPIYRNTDVYELMCGLNEKGIMTVVSHLRGFLAPYSVDMTQGCAIFIGNEANGISDELTDEAECLVKIPMPGNAESMNAGVAGGILIYEAVRQRMFPNT